MTTSCFYGHLTTIYHWPSFRNIMLLLRPSLGHRTRVISLQREEVFNFFYKGTADRCIRFWNTSLLQQVQYVDTGSQVCNLMFSKSSQELVSTHGYSLNQIIVWKYPSMQKITTLTGHTYRVLYLAMSPDGQNIVTGAGDERLRFWNVFPQIKTFNEKNNGSLLFPSNFDVR